MQNDKYMDVEIERDYNSIIVVTIEAHDNGSRFDLNGLR
jgi:hypothetical protein